MYSGYALPFRPKKGQAFTFPAFLMSGTAQRAAIYGVTLTWKVYISKDFAAFVPATNTPIPLDSSAGGLYADGCLKLDLTTDEMNADVIIIRLRARNDVDTADVSIQYGFIIYTDGFTGFGGGGSGSGGVSLDDTVQNISNLPFGAPTLGQAISFLYQYFTKRRKRSSWNLIRHITRG